MISQPQIELRESKGSTCRLCQAQQREFVLFRIATPSIHPYVLLRSCTNCLGVVRELFRTGVGQTELPTGRSVTLSEQNAVMEACPVCAFEAITHGLGVDEKNVLRMCSHCRGAIRDVICA